MILSCQQILEYKRFPKLQNYPTPFFNLKNNIPSASVIYDEAEKFPGISKCSFREDKSMSRDIKLNEP